ncbi:MAG: phage tail protein [Candidatus Aminicenantes bacterium]|nr:phage tail protein [Candidatus Aminicenantes bacterium]
MTAGKRNDPYVSFLFQVEIQGLIVGGFSEVSGLQVETETHDFREGGVNDYMHKLPKGSKQSNITLKRGFTDSDVLWKWHQDVVNGKFKRKSGRIILMDSEGNEKWHWTFEDAFPIKWVGPDFKAQQGATSIESLELAHKGIKKG